MVNADVLIIGAGMAGLTAATELTNNGFKVIVVEKARGSGGRLSSKRVASDGRDDISFDLGCTGLSASTELFKKQLDGCIEEGVAAPWHLKKSLNGSGNNVDSIETETDIKVVGVPRSSSITRHLTRGVDVQFATRISALRKQGEYWESYIEQEGQEEVFSVSKYVVIATPPQQAADLIGSQHPFHDRLENYDMQPQWVVMLALEERVNLNDGLQACLPDSISGASLETSKAGRERSDGVAVWQIQATPEWTLKHLDISKEDAVETMLGELEGALGCSVSCVASYAHRWLYSQPGEPKSAEGYLWGEDNLGLCGDYVASSMSPFGAEAAYLSGVAIAKHIP